MFVLFYRSIIIVCIKKNAKTYMHTVFASTKRLLAPRCMTVGKSFRIIPRHQG